MRSPEGSVLLKLIAENPERRRIGRKYGRLKEPNRHPSLPLFLKFFYALMLAMANAGKNNNSASVAKVRQYRLDMQREVVPLNLGLYDH
jgi:hypothetical protein